MIAIFKKVPLICSFIFVGCATFGPSKNSVDSLTSDLSIDIRCRTRTEVFNEPYLGINCQFKNLTSSLKKLEIESATVVSGRHHFSIVQPKEIKQLEKIYRQRQLDNNNLFFLSGLLTITNILSKNGPGVGPDIGIAIAGFQGSKNSGLKNNYSRSHMLSNKTEMKANSSSTKSILISMKNQEDFPDSIVLCFRHPVSECKKLKIEISHQSYRMRGIQMSH